MAPDPESAPHSLLLLPLLQFSSPGSLPLVGRSHIKMAPPEQLFSGVSTWPMEVPRSLPCQMEDCPTDSCNHTLLFLTHQTLYPVEVWLASVWFPRVLSCCWPDSLSFSTIGLLILGIRYQATVSAEALGDRVKFSEWRSPWSSSFQDCTEEDPLAPAIVVGSENPHHANSFLQRTFFLWPLPFKPHSILGIGVRITRPLGNLHFRIWKYLQPIIFFSGFWIFGENKIKRV